MLSSAETKLLIAGLGLLICGIGSLIIALLMHRGNTTAWKWFGISVKFHVCSGIFATISGLLNLGRLVVPPTLAETYATFNLATVGLLLVGFIVTAIVGRRAR